MFFNSLGHRGTVTNPLERLFSFVDSPSERPWVAMGALGIFILIGASWVNQAQVLPELKGTQHEETTLEDRKYGYFWIFPHHSCENIQTYPYFLSSRDTGWQGHQKCHGILPPGIPPVQGTAGCRSPAFSRRICRSPVRLKIWQPRQLSL